METKENRKWLNRIVYTMSMFVLLGMASLTGYLFRRVGFPETNIVIVYLFAVILTARFSNGYVYSVIASIIATFAFNYFFTAPYYTFAVQDKKYIVTFIIMTITALLTSALTSHARQSAIKACDKEAETKTLYMLTNHLTDASSVHEIAEIATSIISSFMSCKAACLCVDENGQPEGTFVQQLNEEKQINREVINFEDIRNQIDDLNKGYCIDAEFYDWAIYGKENILGIIRIPKEKASLMTVAQTRLLSAMIESIALAMDRCRSVEQRIKYREESLQERCRGDLLRAISHDLRTPLSGIMGTSEMLMDMTNRNDPRYELAKGIYSDADWLHSLVENILSLTRLQDGKLPLKKQREAVEEVVGGAVYHVQQRAPEHEITIDIPDELFLVPMDAKLIEQVLINLLDNAIKHTAPDKGIKISVTKDEKADCSVFTVSDYGEGIDDEDLPNIFQMFYTSKTRRADVEHGIGLGLSICDAIIKAHGGNIEAHNNPIGKGAEFTFTLPMEVEINE